MSKGPESGLLEMLRNKGNGADALTALAARAPAHEPNSDGAADTKLNEVLNRIIQLTGTDVRRGEAAAAAQPSVARAVASTPE